MTPDQFYTRREGDTLSRRVESIDMNGTRGMSMIAESTRQNAQAIGRLQQEVHERFTEHTRQHERETASRKSARRWLVMAWIGAVATGISGLSLLVAILASVHGLTPVR